MTTKRVIKKKSWAIIFLFFLPVPLQYVGSQFPDQGLNPCLPHWKRGVLITGRPVKSPVIFLFDLKSEELSMWQFHL